MIPMNSGAWRNAYDLLGLEPKEDTGYCCAEGMKSQLDSRPFAGGFTLRDFGLVSRAPDEMNNMSGVWSEEYEDDTTSVGLHAQILCEVSGSNPKMCAFDQFVQITKSTVLEVDPRPRHDAGGYRMTGESNHPSFGGFFRPFKEGEKQYVTFVDPTDVGYFPVNKNFEHHREYISYVISGGGASSDCCKYEKCYKKWYFGVSYDAVSKNLVLTVDADETVCVPNPKGKGPR
jgi:hypothetical protein